MKTIPHDQIKDFALGFREDIKQGMLPEIVIKYLQNHLKALRKLPDTVEDKHKSIADNEKFLRELKNDNRHTNDTLLKKIKEST